MSDTPEQLEAIRLLSSKVLSITRSLYYEMKLFPSTPSEHVDAFTAGFVVSPTETCTSHFDSIRTYDEPLTS